MGGSDELSLIQRYLPDAYGIGLFGTYADSLKYINYDDATINVNVDSGITLLSAPPLPRHMDLYNKNNTSKDSASITYNIEYTNKHNDRKQVIAVNKSYNYVINNVKDQLTFVMPENSSFHVKPSNRTIDITIEGIQRKIDLSSHYHNFSIITKLTPGVLRIDQYNKLLFKKGEFLRFKRMNTKKPMVNRQIGIYQNWLKNTIYQESYRIWGVTSYMLGMMFQPKNYLLIISKLQVNLLGLFTINHIKK